jgi:hypothetical protein
MNVFSRIFASDFADVRRRVLAGRHTDELLQRYDINPLMETPFVRMPDGRYLAPSTHFVAQRLSPASLYYVGLGLGAQEFSSDLGTVTEIHVGEQLGLVDTELVLHDLEYAKGHHAADYVVVLPSLTLVIEVKSARVAWLGRLDRQGYLDDLNKDVGKALTQIQRTATMIRSRHPAFAQVDPNQEIRGIIVTAEPHYMLNSPFYLDQITDRGFPTVILSLGELGHAVAAAHAGRPAELFTALTAWNSGGIDVNKVIRAHEQTLGIDAARNPLLDAAYQRCGCRKCHPPWSGRHRPSLAGIRWVRRRNQRQGQPHVAVCGPGHRPRTGRSSTYRAPPAATRQRPADPSSGRLPWRGDAGRGRHRPGPIYPAVLEDGVPQPGTTPNNTPTNPIEADHNQPT